MQDGPIHIHSETGFLRLYSLQALQGSLGSLRGDGDLRYLSERMSSLIQPTRCVVGRLPTAKYPSGAWSANCVIRDRVTEKRGREGRMKRKGAVWSIVGVTNL